MKRAPLALAATAAGLTALALASVPAVAYTPTTTASPTATVIIAYPADVAKIDNCTLGGPTANAPEQCPSYYRYGTPHTDEGTNRYWFSLASGYKAVSGNATYVSKGHKPKVISWLGGHRRLVRSFGGVRYHVWVSRLEVLKRPAATNHATSVAGQTFMHTATFRPASTTTHAPNVRVTFSTQNGTAVKQFKLGKSFYSGCPRAVCGDFRYEYTPVAMLSYIPSPGERFVFGRGWSEYAFPGTDLQRCTVDTWYGGRLKEHDVTVCGHKHGELIRAHAELYHA